MIRSALVALTFLTLPVSALAECIGRDLFEALAPETRAAIDEAVAQVPHQRGLLWRATRGDAEMVLVGTYHFADRRHQAILSRIAGPLADAAALYVEATPEDEERLQQALQRDPSLMFDPDGPTLPERLLPDEWARLSLAIEERGVPAVLASRMRPWYVALLLGVSPCMIETMADPDSQGLDRMLGDLAQTMRVPIRSLEPWDTVFSLFRDLGPDQEEDMIRAALPAAEYADDYAATLTAAYFAGEVWRIWEFGRFDAYENSGLPRDTVDEQIGLAQSLLMDRRNRDWIAPLVAGAESAALQDKRIVAGFGALHLPGEQGVLRLLENQGWQIERMEDGTVPSAAPPD